MKCIRCGHDSKYKERPTGRCPGCGGDFAFEPQKKALFTDLAFLSAIQAVSAEGRVRFGVEHLYYELCRRRRRRRLPFFGGVILFMVAFLIGVQTRSILAGIVIALVATVGAVLIARRMVKPTVAISQQTFNGLWERWRDVHGAPKGLIVRQPPAPAPRPVEPDLADYSFDRAVICDRARTVDLLLANNFHFENNCAVLSIGGYPERPFETVRAMLKKNPRLQVFALHDATAAGCRLARRLADDPGWFKDQVPVTDVGLRPRHARPLKGLWLASSAGPVAAGDGIAGDEAVWLSRYTLELAAIRPEQALKRLFRAINSQSERDRSSDSDNGTRVRRDDDSFETDAADVDGGDDSFG